MRRPNVTCRPGLSYGLAAAVALVSGLPGCGLDAEQGDCGSILSSAECSNVRTQLGTLDAHPPADPTNRFGSCEKDGTSECLLESTAVKLGQRLFFDRCLSVGTNLACVSCHDPAAAFVDDRIRPIMTPPTTFMVNGMAVTMQLPLITPLLPGSVTTPPPAVQPQVDLNNDPLASWDATNMKWVPVNRRPQSSLGSVVSGSPAGTARHSPTLYNIAYGAGIPPSDGGRVAGTIWGPWDGRYDSHWALVANVLEFGATHNTDRSHIAWRVYTKHQAEYEAMAGPLPADFQNKDMATNKYIYPLHGSPSLANKCWYDATDCMDPVSLPPTAAVRDAINTIFVNVGKALSAYMRQLRSANSPYDQWLAGNTSAMSDSAQRGLQLFIGKAECALCHNGPNFTDARFHNLGVPQVDPETRTAGSNLITTPGNAQENCFPGIAPNVFCPDPGRNGWQARAAGQCESDSAAVGAKTATCQRIAFPDSMNRFDIAMDCRSAASDATDKTGDTQCIPQALFPVSKCAYPVAEACQADPLCEWVDMPQPMPSAVPRCVARTNPAELGQFKTQSLRNVALTFPYMHNGALYDYGPAERGETDPSDATPHLRRVVQFYNQGGGTPVVGTLDPGIRPLNLTDAEIDDIVEFLKSLTDNSMATDPLSITPGDLVDLGDCPT